MWNRATKVLHISPSISLTSSIEFIRNLWIPHSTPCSLHRSSIDLRIPTSIYPLPIYILKSRSCSTISSPAGSLDPAILSPSHHHLVPELLKVSLNDAHRTAAERTNPAAKFKKETDALDVRIQGLQEEGHRLRASEHGHT